MALSQGQRNTVESTIDRLIQQAERPFTLTQPTMEGRTGPLDQQVVSYRAELQRYQAARAEYDSNPMRAVIDRARNAANAAGGTQEQKDLLYRQMLAEEKQRMMQAVDGDLVNQQAKQQAQQELVQNLSSLNFTGAIMSVIRMVSGGNEMMDVPGQMLADAFSQQGVDPQRAMDNRFIASGLTSALMGAGIDVRQQGTQQFIASTVAETVAPGRQGIPAFAPALTSTTQVASASTPYSAPNGTLPGAPGSTPLGQPAGQAVGGPRL